MAPLTLQRGQRLKLAQIIHSAQFMVGVKATSPTLQFDVSCFGLDENSKLSDERFFVFFNQKIAPGEGVKMLGARGGDSESFGINLNRLPASIRRLMFVISVDGAGEMSQMGNSHLRILVAGQEHARFSFSGQDLGRERALLVVELYFKDEWRINAVGQGFAGGLDAVLVHFGGSVAEKPTATPPPPTPRQTVASPPPSPHPLPPLQNDGKTCIRCGRSISFWDKTMGRFNAFSGRCNACEQAVVQEQAYAAAQAAQAKANALTQAQSAFVHLCNQASFDGNTWQNIKRRTADGGVSSSELLNSIRPTAFQFLEDLIQQSAAEGIITADEDQQWSATLRALDLPQDWLAPFHARWQQEKQLSEIRQGKLPKVQADFHMDSDEVCYLLVHAEFLKETARSRTRVPVRLAATSKKLYIIERGAGGKEISYAKFLNVLPSSNSVSLELSVKTGAGTYYVDDPATVDAILTTLVKMHKRQLVHENEARRGIPHEIKIAVWQRDRGRCVQCGVTGKGACLEYDHDIPFSLGGASTVDNLRLLCRQCNAKKGNRL